MKIILFGFISIALSAVLIGHKDENTAVATKKLSDQHEIIETVRIASKQLQHTLEEICKDSHDDAKVIISHNFVTKDNKDLKSLAAKIHPKISELKSVIQSLTDKLDS